MLDHVRLVVRRDIAEGEARTSLPCWKGILAPFVSAEGMERSGAVTVDAEMAAAPDEVLAAWGHPGSGGCGQRRQGGTRTRECRGNPPSVNFHAHLSSTSCPGVAQG